MIDREVLLAKLTRREFREAMDSGKFQTAIIPTGSNEQHLEHLAMEHDSATAIYLAVEVARRLYPKVIVTVPMAIGISEHHMTHKGTISAKPGGWLSVLFDSVESLIRHGVKNVLILNGHGGNNVPIQGVIDQWRLFFKLSAPQANLLFCCYWDWLPQKFQERYLKADQIPGHATEFETAFALALFPENVRFEAMQEQENQEPLRATAEAGSLLTEETVQQLVDFVKGMIEGRNVAPEVKHYP
jgi:creatinine amidohydrolase